MTTKAWVVALIKSAIITIVLIILCDHFLPEDKVMTKVIPLVIGALITNYIRKSYDGLFDIFNRKSEKPFLGVLIKTNHKSRRIIGFGSSCGNVVPAGHFKADHEVEVELNVIIQNESPYTVYEVDISYAPNQYSEKYTLIDKRENKLQPLEGNKHFDFTLRIMKHYYDVYASDVDQELYRIGKGISPLNGSKLIIKYKDSKHKAQVKTQVLE